MNLNVIIKSKLSFSLSILLFYFLQCSSQTLVELQSIGEDAKRNGIDTIIVYSSYFIGAYEGRTVMRNETKEERFEKNCEASHTLYLIYKLDGKIIIEKRNKCYMYRPVQLDSSVTLTYFLKNFNLLKQDTILTCASEKFKKGCFLDHDMNYNLFFSLGPETRTTMWKGMDLAVSTYPYSENYLPEDLNFNRERNLNSKLNKLSELIETEVKSIRFEKP
jgi:hypothetical protein